MKKILFVILPLFLFVSFCNNPTDVKNANELVGKWITRDHFNDTLYQREFEFTNEYKFHNIYSVYISNILDQQKFLNGNYSLSGNRLTCVFTDKTKEQFYYEIKFELLRLYTTDYSDTLILVKK